MTDEEPRPPLFVPKEAPVQVRTMAKMVKKRPSSAMSHSPTESYVDVQSWNKRVKSLLPSSLVAVSDTIELRTEFSGAMTAEISLSAAAQLAASGHQPSITHKSCGDWNTSARAIAMTNFPEMCVFSDIMGMATDHLKKQLTQEVAEKAIFVYI